MKCLGVVGLGLIGGSILRRFAESPSEYEPVGFDSDAETSHMVRSEGFTVARSSAALARRAELLVVAVPPRETARVVLEVLRANPLALVTDVASVKAPVLDDVRRHAPDAVTRFLPAHPLAGAETPGWRRARSDLLDGAIWAVCPPSGDAGAELLCRWSGVFDAFDARIVVCDPLEHDLAVARTSHAPHIAAEIIAGTLDRAPAKLAAALSGGAFRDMTRIARSDHELWSQIFDLNRDAVVAVIDEWLAELHGLRSAVEKGQEPALTKVWTQGKAMVELVDELRWQAPAWEDRVFQWPAWDALCALGREGRAIRRVNCAVNRISAQVSVSP